MTSGVAWRVTTLGELVVPVRERSKPPPNSELPYLGMEHVEAQTGRVLVTGRASEITSSSPLVRPRDVLYGRLRPYLNKVAVAPFDAYASGEFIVFRENDAIDSRFLKWRLSAPDFVEYAVALNTGDRPRVKWPQMASFELSLPPLEEQRRVIEVLEDRLSLLSAGVQQAEFAQVRLNALRKGLVDSLLSKVPTTTLPLSELLLRQTSGSLIDQGWSPKCLPERARDGSWGVLKTTSVQWSHFLPTENKTLPEHLTPRPNIEVNRGDLLVTRAGPRSRCGVVALVRDVPERLMLCDKMYRMRADPSAVRPEVLEAALRSHEVRLRIEALKTGISDSGLNLTQSRFLKMPVTIPKRPYQDAFLREIEQFEASCVRLASACEATLARAANLRRSLIAGAFAGHSVDSLTRRAPEAAR